MLRQKLSKEERRTRSHRLIVRGAVFESIVPEAKDMTDEEATTLLRLALTSEPVREYLKKRAGNGNARINPLDTKGALIHPNGRVRSAEGFISAQGFYPALRLAALPQTGDATLPPATACSVYPFVYLRKSNTLLRKLLIFHKFYIRYTGGDTHSHLPL